MFNIVSVTVGMWSFGDIIKMLSLKTTHCEGPTQTGPGPK